MGKKLEGHIWFSSTSLNYYRKHTNDNNKISPLPSSVCFQQPFPDWFSVLRYNLDLKKLQWATLWLTSNKSVISQIDANCSPFQLLNMLPFHIKPERLKLTCYSLISNYSKYYFKIWAICLLFYFTCISHFRTWQQLFCYPTLENSKATLP